MAASFDTDVAGAVLEWGVFHRSGNQADRNAWVGANVRGQPGIEVWRAAGLERSHLLEVLRPGRNEQDVRRKLIRAFVRLENEHLIEPLVSDDNPRTLLREVTALGQELVGESSHIEYLGGLRTVVERWKASVAMIYNPKGQGVGTGFLVAPDLVATAAHVIEDLPAFSVCLEGDSDVPHEAPRAPGIRAGHTGPEWDVALIPIDRGHGRQPMRLARDYDVLDSVVVFGYPPVPQSDDAYLLAHSGEVSAVVQVRGFQVIVVSCLVRGGHSGGPVLNRRGQVVGVVSGNLSSSRAPDDSDINNALGVAAVVPVEILRDLIDGLI